MVLNNLTELVELNSSFKTAVNLYLSLNKKEKILNYIPTMSSIGFMDEYLKAIIENKEQSTILIGPYGKGKSHLLLVLLAILTLERNAENESVINELISKVRRVDEMGERVAEDIERVWKTEKKYLPVVLNSSEIELNQAFLSALNDALKREGLLDLVPDTFYSIALKRIDDWEKNYPTTYNQFGKELKNIGKSISEIKGGIQRFSKDALNSFVNIYPKITAGSEFNPLAVSEVLPLYKSVSEKLAEDYGYSGIYIVFDEFSKYIEGLEGSTVGSNMKILQDICELANESQNSKIYITLVAHKSIKEYGKYLSQDIINAFTGIEGRIIEKYFITSSKNNYELIKNAIIKQNDKLKYLPEFEKILGEDALENYYRLPAFRSKFEKNDFKNTVLYGCFPLSPVAAYLLLNVSEKVAQNERTLFTFISNDEPNSMARFIAEHTNKKTWVINADLIYDYFRPLFKKEVSNELVHNLWLGAEYALSKCSNQNEEKVIKTLAIVLIVNKEDEMPADDVYLQLAVNDSNAMDIIEELKKKELIYKKASTGEYAFKTKAGSALKKEIKRQRDLKGNNVNYSKALLMISRKYYVLPRKYNTINMITRYFRHEYMDVDAFLDVEKADTLFDNSDNADGKVLTLFSFSAVKQDKVKKHIKDLCCDKLVVVSPGNTIELEKQLRDFEIVQELKENQAFNQNNEVMQRELPILEDDIISKVEETLIEVYEDNSDCKVFYYSDGKVKISKDNRVETAVNNCCEKLFVKAPMINNELINRSEITTGQTKKARLNIIKAILTHQDDEDFYSGTNQEATIYRSLFCSTGLLYGKETKQLHDVIEIINDFINSCADEKKSMHDLVAKLNQPPYGLRKSIIPIYLSYVFSKRREDLIVYFVNSEIQMDAEVVIGMCEYSNDYSLFVSKEDIQKESYINDLRELFQVSDNRNLTDDRIKDIVVCMQRWFRALPLVTRNLAIIEEYDVENKVKDGMKIIKKHLQRVDYNPFEMLFVQLPDEFGNTSLEETYKMIDDCYMAYEDYFDWIQNKTVDAIYKIFSSKKKMDLFHIVREWYDNQSEISKQGLHSSKITTFMTCIENMNVYNDSEVCRKIVKAVTDVYMENWNELSMENFKNDLTELKKTIENYKEIDNEMNLKLSFYGKNGQLIEKYYKRVDESTGNVFRNILEDAIDENDDLSINDRVAILLEMIEKMFK